MARDRGLVSEKEQLKALIRAAAKDGPTMSELVRRLRAKGVQVRANIARTGHVSGISYRLDRVAVKGSGLGRAYSFEGLQKEQGVRYDRGRDLPALERAARATKGLEPLRRRRRPLRLPSPSRALSRLPGYREARTALWLGGPEYRRTPASARRQDCRSRHSQRHRPLARQVIHERGREGRGHRQEPGPANRGGPGAPRTGFPSNRCSCYLRCLRGRLWRRPSPEVFVLPGEQGPAAAIVRLLAKVTPYSAPRAFLPTPSAISDQCVLALSRVRDSY
jgi:hypothetical protein